MSPELDANLCVKYPDLFKDRYGNMQETAMCWGFECGDGWYNILDQLCNCIQNHVDWIKKTNKSNTEYNQMQADLIAGESAKFEEMYKTYTEPSREKRRLEIINGSLRETRPEPDVTVVQVKEKFGTLRFYYEGGDDYTDGMVSMAECMSSVTCEKCGKPGQLRGKGWLYTACDEHVSESNE